MAGKPPSERPAPFRVQSIDENARADSISPLSRSHTESDIITLRPSTDGSSSVGALAPDPSGRSSRASSVTTAAASPVDAEAALRPDPGSEADFRVDDNPFAFSPGQLNKLLNPKSLDAFRALGGIRGVERGLQSDIVSGLGFDEVTVRRRVTFSEAVQDAPKSELKTENVGSGSGPFADRIRVFSRNVLPEKKPTPYYKLMLKAYNEKVLIVLTVAAFISLALGLYETLGTEHPPGGPPPIDWVEGMAICVAIIIVVVVGSFNDWQKERAFVRLNAKKEDREIKVIRSGKPHVINVADIVVGDVLQLEPGDIIPVDGIFINGHNMKCDESSATGESDSMKKTGAEQVLRMLESGTREKDLDPFIISGAKVLEGIGTFMCTSVGVHSSFGKIMISVRTEVEATPLQKKLAVLGVDIAKWAVTSASFLFFVLLFRFLANLPNDSRSPTEKASFFLDIFIVAITVIVVAVPEGLPLAVTLALAFATTKLLKENNLVRILRACETMGNATTICSDKTGTLTTNKMTVVAGTFGGSTSKSKFAKPEEDGSSGSGGSQQTVAQWANTLPRAVRDIIVQSVATNSTAFEADGDMVGPKTETALLKLAKDHLGLQSLLEHRGNETVLQMMPFDSAKKCMAAVVRLPSGQGCRLLVKGASEILLGYCNSKIDVENGEGLTPVNLTATDQVTLRSTIETYARQSLRTIGLVYRDYPQWPPAGVALNDGQVQMSSILKDLVFLGVVGIQDPVRPGVPDAVRKAQMAGVTIRMVTGDNAITAQAIATECGIYSGGVIMEGPEFRTLDDAEMTRIIPRLQVLARSSPEDKRILVQKLKAMNETVAVTGDGTNDAPALKAADIGFSMGISGTEVAKEASSIILMDDNFSSIIVALKWGRAVNDAVQKFLQFQITVSITAVILAFVSAVSHPEMKSVLTAVQLLWVNLFMDTMAGIVLATDPPTDRILNRLPQGKSAPLITMNMWKMIIGQTIFQLAVTIVLNFAGAKILGYDPDDETRMLQLDTIIFNVFVWMQIFNEFNCRRLDNGYNIFAGLQRNPYFVCINTVMAGCQIAIIFVGGAVFTVTALDGRQWAVCIVLPMLSLPWAMVVRSFPDELFARIVGVVTFPFVAVYGVASRVLSPVFAKILPRRSRKVGGVDNNGNGVNSPV